MPGIVADLLQQARKGAEAEQAARQAARDTSAQIAAAQGQAARSLPANTADTGTPSATS